MDAVANRCLRQTCVIFQRKRIAALCRNPLFHRLKGRAGGNRTENLLARIIGLPAVAQHQHVDGQHDADLTQRRIAAPLQNLGRFHHLKRVADGVAQRHIHIGQHRRDITAALFADGNHVFSQPLRVLQRLHKRARADLDVQHDGVRTRRQLF